MLLSLMDCLPFISQKVYNTSASHLRGSLLKKRDAIQKLLCANTGVFFQMKIKRGAIYQENKH